MGDLDGDGRSELVLVGSDDNLSSWRLDGSAPPRRLGRPSADLSTFDACLLVADLDGDGRQEVIVQGKHVDGYEFPDPVFTDLGPISLPPKELKHDVLLVLAGFALGEVVAQSL